MAAQITAWSYSRYACYTECPMKAKLKFVDRLQEPGSSAMDRGTAIHKQAEEFVLAPKAPTGKAFPVELKLIKDELMEARKGQPRAEQEWAFTTQWEPTGWFSKDAWCRIKTDLVFSRKGELVIVDHKTGKRKETHRDQLSLYALGGFIMYPDVDVIRTSVWYIDQGKPHTEDHYERAELPDIQNAWLDKTRPMLTDTTFAPRPGNYCRWCHFRKSNGGPCQY